jgi:hypothetical protein
MKNINRFIIFAFLLLLTFSALVIVEVKAQVFTPFFIGNNPPLVSPRPPTITDVLINGTNVTNTLDTFQTQTGDVWHDWEPTGQSEQ